MTPEAQRDQWQAEFVHSRNPFADEGGKGDFMQTLLVQLTMLEGESSILGDATIASCESVRFGLQALDDALNGSLAGLQNTTLKIDRSDLKFFVSKYFPSGLDRGDVGWGERCPKWIGTREELCEHVKFFFDWFEQWDDTLQKIGLFEPAGRLGAVLWSSDQVLEALSCDVADE